jgi:hypothetical protein
MPCLACVTSQRQFSKPKETIEVVPESTKSSRKQFRRDILQPFRGGVLSKEYLQAYGTKGINVDAQEIKNAKNVWKENSYYEGE